MKRAGWIIVAISLLKIHAVAQEISFAVGNWEPYTSEYNNGLAVDIVQAACEFAEIDFSVDYQPWRRVEHVVQNGSYFGTFPYAATEQRLKTYLFSDPFISAKTVLLYNREQGHFNPSAIRTLSDLSGYSIGIMVSTDVIKDILLANGALVEETETIDSSLAKLEMNRIDCIVEDYYIAMELLKKTKHPGIAIYEDISTLFPIREYRIMVSRQYPDAEDLISRLNTGIAAVVSSPVYNTILSKYR